MAYRVERDEDVNAAVIRITTELVDRAIADIDDQDLDDHEAVHEVRKRCKEIRGLFRLVRGAAPERYEQENRWYRDLARELAPLRDAQAHIESFDLVIASFDDTVDREAFVVVRETLEERRDDLDDELDIDARLSAARASFEEGRDRAQGFTIDGADGFDALAGGLHKTYARAHDRLTDAFDRRTTEAFHQWRKRVKYHRYHVELLQEAWPDVLDPRGEELHDLTDITGDDHDLAVLRRTLTSEDARFPSGDPLDAFVALLDRKRARLQREAEPLGTKLFSEEPSAFVDRMRTYWEQWRAGPTPELAHATAVVQPGS